MSLVNCWYFGKIPKFEGFSLDYHWRIDEVNDLNPDSPLKGDIWSFRIAPKTAYEPVPSDGSKFIDPENLILNWTAGMGAKLHTVYFGDDFDTVANATGGLAEGVISFSPGPLEIDKTYYWRVDEFDAVNTYTGDVWSFTTAKAGGGIRGDYYKGMNFENLVLTRTDPRIDFSWGESEPDPAVGANNFSVRWTGEVVAAFTETYTFYTKSDDGIRLWINGRQLIDNWTDHSNTENSGKIDLVAGNTYGVVMEMYENGGGDLGNAAESLYVALNGTAVVYNNNSDATQTATWTQWTIDLQAFADQGVDLTNVNTIAIGLGTKGNLTTPGGTGKIYIDDIHLLKPPSEPESQP